MAATKGYPASKEEIIHFLQPFTNDLKIMVEYYDADYRVYRLQEVESIRYEYPIGGEGTVIFSNKAP
jgi:hypothetical protein